MKWKGRAYCHDTRGNGPLFHLEVWKETDKMLKIEKSKLQSQIGIAFRIIASHIEYRKMSKNVDLVVSGGRVQVVISTSSSLKSWLSSVNWDVHAHDLLAIFKSTAYERQWWAEFEQFSLCFCITTVPHNSSTTSATFCFIKCLTSLCRRKLRLSNTSSRCLTLAWWSRWISKCGDDNLWV